MKESKNSFGARQPLKVGDNNVTIFRLDVLSKQGFAIERLPYSLKILLENLLRHEDGLIVTRDDILALAKWIPSETDRREIAFTPARTLLQDFTGVPAIVDLAAMRDAIADLGGDPERINPLQPVELVIDHSIQVDYFATPDAMEKNGELDYQRNAERYGFLRWGQNAFSNFKVVPPHMGICHQVNLEYLARVVFYDEKTKLAYPDTCVGTDSHTPMVNGLGVLAWGVGGIEAEAAMLGQPISMLIPEVVGFRLKGSLRKGVTATDLVLTITEKLRKKGVVGKFVEFFGKGISSLSIADRATLGNMSPEYGATCAIFPPDAVTLDYLRFTGRSAEQIALIESYMKEQGLFYDEHSKEPDFSDQLELDLAEVEPSIAGPRRPQDRIPLSQVKQRFAEVLPELKPPSSPSTLLSATEEGQSPLNDGSIVIAAITSCTNTSNPSVMLAAGLLAKKSIERGLQRKPWVKTSLAPGSQVVTKYYKAAGLLPYLEALGFNLAGYGCTTCIGNSGPLAPEILDQINNGSLVAVAVLSGNRNFEGRINPDVRANFLMSPPLVVAYAIAGHIAWDPNKDPLGTDQKGQPVFLHDIWPSEEEINDAIRIAIHAEMFKSTYEKIYDGDERWQSLSIPRGNRFEWDPRSTYIRKPPYFEGMNKEAPRSTNDIEGARVLAYLGDSVTTDHISPAGSIKKDSPAAQYFAANAIEAQDFNSYGSRRGNHEIMVRGTFASSRLKNHLVPEKEGGYTRYLPSGEILTIYDASTRYQKDGIALCILAGKEYGSGSSRDWAAKGPYLQGVRFIIAESYERIHRSNLLGMGILPLQFLPGENAQSLSLTGKEIFSVIGLKEAIDTRFAQGREVKVRADKKEFRATVRIDTPQELLYFLNGGILHYVLRQLASGREKVAVISAALATSPQPHPNSHPGEQSVHEASEESFPASDPPAY